jgi:hypothetical protein
LLKATTISKKCFVEAYVRNRGLYLAKGTALALHCQHRSSFERAFSPVKDLTIFSSLKNFRLRDLNWKTLDCHTALKNFSCAMEGIQSLEFSDSRFQKLQTSLTESV